MYALDTNLLVYAHNTASPLHPQAKAFIEKVMNERDAEGKLSVCIPGQVLMEFLNVITSCCCHLLRKEVVAWND